LDGRTWDAVGSGHYKEPFETVWQGPMNNFFVAQAFTPGGMKSDSLKSPINGALVAPRCFSPRRKRQGWRKPYDEITSPESFTPKVRA
jgi:hypothetical protein